MLRREGLGEQDRAARVDGEGQVELVGRHVVERAALLRAWFATRMSSVPRAATALDTTRLRGSSLGEVGVDEDDLRIDGTELLHDGSRPLPWPSGRVPRMSCGAKP